MTLLTPILPVYSQGRLSGSNFSTTDVKLRIYLKDKERHQNNYHIDLETFFTKHGIRWRYISFAFDEENNLCCYEGSPSSGYMVAVSNKSVSNKNLLLTIFEKMNLLPPTKPGEKACIYLNAEKEQNYFILKQVKPNGSR